MSGLALIVLCLRHNLDFDRHVVTKTEKVKSSFDQNVIEPEKVKYRF